MNQAAILDVSNHLTGALVDPPAIHCPMISEMTIDGHVMDILHHESTDEFYERTQRDYTTWLDDLKPFIRNYFLDLPSHAPNARYGYIPIIPRYWWHRLARQFARDIDFYICALMPKEIGIPVKRIPTRSIYYYEDKAKLPLGVHDDVVKAFIDDDKTHLVHNGYELVVMDAG